MPGLAGVGHGLRAVEYKSPEKTEEVFWFSTYFPKFHEIRLALRPPYKLPTDKCDITHESKSVHYLEWSHGRLKVDPTPTLNGVSCNAIPMGFPTRPKPH